MNTKDLLSIADLTASETNDLIIKAFKMKAEEAGQPLCEKAFALIFEKPSLRTRVSFELAIQQLGGFCIYLSPDEVGLGKREPVADVAQVLGRFVHGIVARTFSHQTLETLAKCSNVPIINALSDWEHPCQALADILTIYEKKGRLQGLSLTYIGDGNNVANSLLLACSQTGINFQIASPPGYELQKEILQTGREIAAETGSKITLTNNPGQSAKDTDIIYTDVWTSMGQETEAAKRRNDFSDYQINDDLLSLAKKDVIFMHPLPAHHGEEVAAGLLDHPCSVVYDQAENRLHIQKALLAELFRDYKREK